ncbi:Guanine nucleotide-binding protein alpha-15 subunit [Caenorhabditis elegans]|uniref:Guanine nucleotide-binding protein alpha-15 subunit n=1 Tax=Caenorhabditis elegans TaxID=6239 RepID=GPA15_CAEEL|nr:Guanine nucleotide-binding protein alpha-15 subunit [Caenorhabditis elegans]P91907.2 RecName: Full=Guanine nucleotide-binding protein alpha-15 subunit [Caenorhabditis elegans]AAG32090.1 heterotrimeric G protein alpha subunit [Caenorhabditis elegans]CAB05570.2 Guanine nucleotide-binding protein alpha-15 subunit [Caenorhabditis elegans]|eukprot:NP_492312.1 Guanine nucleotide-binding protein alpha-15 subunit [Caenorhabditis elegans]
MGSTCSTPESKEQKRINSVIDKQIRKDEDDEIGNQKLLLLGTGECGKSTILKQINILHSSGFSKADLKNVAGTVYSNIIQGVATLLKAKDHFYYELSTPELDADAQHILSLADSSKDAMPFIPLTFNAIKRLWHDPVVQKTFERRAEFQMMDTLVYFMNELDRINNADYIPTVDDMLRIRIPTMGVVQQTIEIKGTKFRIYDVGGQRSERRKWIHLFDNVNATIFISAINEFNQKLNEDGQTNRMKESIKLFETICNSRWFVQAAMILFLNKRDLFEQKLKTTSINVLFSTYQGSNDYAECVAYIQMRFERLNKYSDIKKIYTHVTCATDTNQIQLVIDSVVDMVIGRNLRGTGME